MFTDIVTEMFASFSTVITGIAGGLKTAFNHLVYASGAPGLEAEISPLVIFGFVVGGVALATGLFFGIFGMVKGALSKK